MRFTVPQFIDYEAKVIGPFTFKQFIYIGIAGSVCFVLYFTIPFQIFLIACFFIMGLALAFALVKIGGKTLPSIIANIFKFGLSPKTYIWKKREKQTVVYKKAVKPEVKEDEGLPLKIAADSQLKKLRTTIETKNK